jgi:hypothetical protein
MKARHTRRLNLKKTTLRVLTESELSEARSGAVVTGLCTTQTKSMDGCVWPAFQPTGPAGTPPDQIDPVVLQPVE